MGNVNHVGLNIDIINIRFKYSDTVSNIEYSDSDTNRSEPL